MRIVLLCTVVLSLAPGHSTAAGTKPTPAPVAKSAPKTDRGGWPDTRVGELARLWVAAFSSGEAAMKEYLTTHMASTSLDDRSVARRVERYRELRETYGKLELASVVKSEPGKLTVKLMSSDATRREFIFTAQAEAPYKLLSVAIREGGHHGFGGAGH